jgi:hypothetical protein
VVSIPRRSTELDSGTGLVFDKAGGSAMSNLANFIDSYYFVASMFCVVIVLNVLESRSRTKLTEEERQEDRQQEIDKRT